MLYMHQRSSPFDNLLLASLGQPEWLRLQPYVERVTLTRNQSLYESGQTLSHAYFPTTALVSMMYVSHNGDCAESALVGNDGMLGVCLFMGGGSTCSCAQVQTTGEAFRLPRRILQDEFNRIGPTMQILLRYAQALLTQTAQRAICARHHMITQQVAFCLLQHADRSFGNEVLMTHDQISQRLGVRREGVTEGAGQLQKRGLIRYSRGHVSVLDRDGLEGQACECYAVLRHECQRLLPVMPRPEHMLAAA